METSKSKPHDKTGSTTEKNNFNEVKEQFKHKDGTNSQLSTHLVTEHEKPNTSSTVSSASKEATNKNSIARQIKMTILPLRQAH